MEVVGAAGCEHPGELTPRHILHRVTQDVAEPGHRAYQLVEPGALISSAAASVGGCAGECLADIAVEGDAALGGR